MLRSLISMIRQQFTLDKSTDHQNDSAYKIIYFYLTAILLHIFSKLCIQLNGYNITFLEINNHYKYSMTP